MRLINGPSEIERDDLKLVPEELSDQREGSRGGDKDAPYVAPKPGATYELDFKTTGDGRIWGKRDDQAEFTQISPDSVFSLSQHIVRKWEHFGLETLHAASEKSDELIKQVLVHFRTNVDRLFAIYNIPLPELVEEFSQRPDRLPHPLDGTTARRIILGEDLGDSP